MLRVLHVNEFVSQKGGVEAYLRSLVPLLEKEGLTQYFAYGEGEGDDVKNAIQIPGIRSTVFRENIEAEKLVSGVLDNVSPDVVHVHNIKNIGVLNALVKYGKCVFTTHDYRLVCPASTFFYKRSKEMCTKVSGLGCFTTTLSKHCMTPRPRYARYFYDRVRWFKKNYRNGIELIAPSQGAKTRFVEAGCREESITVLPYFCPLKPLEEPRPVPESPRITFMGRIAPSKGYGFFVEALGLLPENVSGVMVGSFSAESEKRVKNLARKYGCLDRLELKGWASREEVVQIIDQTSVFVFPSIWPETLGIVGIEALSRGVPVVASDIGGVREWLVDGFNGFLAEPGHASQISEGVKKIIASHQNTMEFGRNGIKHVNTKFLPELHIRQLLAIYERIASGKQ